MTQSNSDRIEKTLMLHVPRARVWRALTDATEFGQWFRCQLDGDFVPGQRLTGRITAPGCEHLKMELWVERMDAPELFSLRWHPHAVDPSAQYSSEPTTLVEFKLAEVSGGTQLTVVESGFDALPAPRREVAFRENGQGWTYQCENIRQHVSG